MADTKPISIRLSPSPRSELERRANAEAVSAGILAKRLLESLLEQASPEPVPPQQLDATKLAEMLGPLLEKIARSAFENVSLRVLTEIVGAITALKTELQAQRQDLRTLADLLEAPPDDQHELPDRQTSNLPEGPRPEDAGDAKDGDERYLYFDRG